MDLTCFYEIRTKIQQSVGRIPVYLQLVVYRIFVKQLYAVIVYRL